MLLDDKRESNEDMSKQTIKSLTRKGYSQYNIAIKLHIRKSKVVAAQRKAGIGVRLKTGAAAYWRDVSKVMEAADSTRSEASAFVGRSKKWGSKRAKRQGKHWSEISKRQKFWKDWKEAWRKATEEEKDKLAKKAAEWKEEEYYGDTPF